MKFRKLDLVFLLLSLNTLLCCGDSKGKYVDSDTLNSNHGISLDTLDLIYDGPRGFTLEYFSKAAIHKAGIKECEIIQQNSISSRVARKVQFDRKGNLVIDENKFYSAWFEGTARGTYNYQYSSVGKTKMTGIPEEDSKDSIMTVWNYNEFGLLYSRDNYQFERKIKPGADRHLPHPEDFEKYPTWNKQKTYRFSTRFDTVVIETLFEDKIVNQEKYKLVFDDSKRLTTVNKFENGSLVEETEYIYEPKTITGSIKRIMNDGTEWTYKSKAVLNDMGLQIEKIVFKNDDAEQVKMIVSYDDKGIIKTIRDNIINQEFKYSYFEK